MSEQHESKIRSDDLSESATTSSPRAVKAKGLHVPMPAVLMGLGMLSGSASAVTTIQDVYSTAVNTSLSGVNLFAADAANNPQSVSCTAAAHGFANVSPTGDLFYTPFESFIGVDSLSCTATDNLGNVNATASIYVGVPIPSTAALPALNPLALGGLAGLIGYLGLRRRNSKA